MRRGLFLSTPSYGSPDDTWSPKWYFLITLVWLAVNLGNNEIVDSSGYIASQPVHQFCWTSFCVPNLRSRPARPVIATAKGKNIFDWNLERKALAEWVLALGVEAGEVCREGTATL